MKKKKKNTKRMQITAIPVRKIEWYNIGIDSSYAKVPYEIEERPSLVTAQERWYHLNC